MGLIVTFFATGGWPSSDYECKGRPWEIDECEAEKDYEAGLEARDDYLPGVP